MLYCKNQGISLNLVIFRCVSTSKTDKLTNRQLGAIVVLGYSTSKAAAKLKTWGKMYTVWHISQLKDYLCLKNEKKKNISFIKTIPYMGQYVVYDAKNTIFCAKSLVEVWKIGLWVSKSPWMIYFFKKWDKDPHKITAYEILSPKKGNILWVKMSNFIFITMSKND